MPCFVVPLPSLKSEPRYSLWTGDVGAALFASDCLDARARYPDDETGE